MMKKGRQEEKERENKKRNKEEKRKGDFNVRGKKDLYWFDYFFSWSFGVV